ncbi:dehydrogenase [Mycolicibacterium farcinogenes]|uniref:Putative short-chain dehydrogenase/reductase n=2 Tax=Mycobacteriaceae TaxID=1762 RepID=A0A378W552_9MYCO|nr:dehydrogenase [Mycolicibacterium farcinogenes]SUA28175.1 putative short-chain dehydrogenase/reductase [Mycolicibacterium senegalense]
MQMLLDHGAILTSQPSARDDIGSYDDPMSLNGKTALVTGATSGIGHATAALLAERGAHVIVSGRDAERGAKVVTEIRDAGGTADFLGAALTDAASAHALVQDAMAVAGQIDILINNAAIAVFGPTAAIAEQDFDDCYALNVKIPFFLVGAVAPAMAARGNGAIVNVSTMVSQFGAPGSAVYASSKAALNLLTKSWAAEYGPKGVRVNAVAPGPTLTEGTTAQYGTERLAALAAQAPARRVADPAEIATTIGFLVSADASFIHGAVLAADGGRTAI